MKRKLFVQLGRAGDILNILPLCEWEFKRTGEPPMLMVAEAFASLLDGVSYVERVVWCGRFEEIAPALGEAERIASFEGAEIHCTQIYAKGLVCLEQCTSFMRESWARYPDAPTWGTLPLTFDRRDKAIEESVKSQMLRGYDGRYVVVALSGTSSPFENAPELKAALRHSLDRIDVKVVDVSGFVAPRFFDLLSLLEGAAALVAVDSGVLHLAHAVPTLPVVALVTREPSRWHGSPYRQKHYARFFYDEAPECISDIVAAVAQIEAGAGHYLHPNIVHVWSHFESGGFDADTRRRMDFARATWAEEYKQGRWTPMEFGPTHALRDSSNIEDPRPVPYIRDLINLAMDHQGSSDDIIAYTNADVCFAPGLTGLIYDVVGKVGAAYTHRYDFYRPLDRPLRNESEVGRGRWYPGSDAFFFTEEWWRQHGHEMPDMVIGREHVDEVLRQLIKRHGGLEIPKAIYHEKHASYWEHWGHRETNQGNLYNRRLARRWFLRTGYAPNDPEWWKIPA